MDKVAALRGAELFAGLQDDVLRNIASCATVRHLTRGEMLYWESDCASGLFVILSGELRSVRQSNDGREQVLSTEVCGATLAVVPVFDGGTYFSTVIADTASMVLCVRRPDVDRLCEQHPELLWNVARVLARQVRYCGELIESLVFQNVDQRLAHYLITVAKERGIRSPDGGVVFELTLTRSEIASRLGSVREVISRSLSHLHDTGLIRLHGNKGIAVPDINALCKFAGETS